MKKILLSLSLVCALSVNAQVFTTDDFSSYTLGNIGTDLTGTTAGQGGWKTIVAATGLNSDFQVVDVAGANGHAIQITGSNNDANRRTMFKDLTDPWVNRTVGNDFAEVEFDMFSGAPTTSLNTLRVLLFNTDGTKVLGGYDYSLKTKILSGVIYYEDLTTTPPSTAGNYFFHLGGGANDITLDDNTWYSFGISFDSNTGDVSLKEKNGLLLIPTVPGAAGFEEVGKFYVQVNYSNAAGNTVAGTGLFDNVTVRATSEESLFLASPTFNIDNSLTVYPNPVKDIVSVKNSQNIAVNGITITDLNGRTVKTVNYNTVSDNIQVNVSDLSSGVYMMNIKSDKGSVTKKIVKN